MKALRGFTLIELVTTIIILGIIAVVAMPKIFDHNVFDAVGFRDATISLLRFGQKSAVAQRRTVCARFSATQAWLTMRSTAGDTACGVHASPGAPAPAGEVLLAGPTGTAPFLVTAQGGTGYTPTPASFYFLASGQPSAGQSFSVTGSGSVAVEAVTGYVH